MSEAVGAEVGAIGLFASIKVNEVFTAVGAAVDASAAAGTTHPLKITSLNQARRVRKAELPLPPPRLPHKPLGSSIVTISGGMSVVVFTGENNT
jgi:hypothetical protein